VRGDRALPPQLYVRGDTMKQRREDAVSPVVGVMLMLVVTIIIAAVVSGFAGGLASGTDKAPQAAFEAKISESSMGGAYGYEFTLKHLSGDPVDTRYIKLVTSWVNASDAYQVQETIAPRRGAAEDQEYFPGNYTNYLLDSLNTHYNFTNDVYYHAPYKVIPGETPANGVGEEETLWFGNYIMRAGDVAKAIMNIGPSNDATPLIKNWEHLTGNEVVNVKLIDLRSSTTIFDKNVVVGV